MSFITPAQCRAARALLEWGQQELSTKSGVHLQTIGTFERGDGSPSKKTLQKIASAFENAGIEFQGSKGLRQSDGDIITYKGAEGLRNFYDDIYETAKKQGGEICQFNGAPGKLIEFLGHDWYEKHALRMIEISGSFSFKIIVAEGETNFIARNFAEYKTFPKSQYYEKTIHCHGQKVAFINFSKNDVDVLVIQQAEIANSFKILFNIAWDQNAKLPTKKS